MALAPEAQSPDQPKRRLVAGLHVGLQAMQAQATESVGDREAQPLSHQALVFMGCEGVVAQIRAAKRSPHDFTDVDDANQLTGGAQAYEVSGLRGVPGAAQIGAVSLGGRRRRNPRGMQRAAAPRRSEEFAGSLRRWPRKADPRLHCTRRLRRCSSSTQRAVVARTQSRSAVLSYSV